MFEAWLGWGGRQQELKLKDEGAVRLSSKTQEERRTAPTALSQLACRCPEIHGRGLESQGNPG